VNIVSASFDTIRGQMTETSWRERNRRNANGAVLYSLRRRICQASSWNVAFAFQASRVKRTCRSQTFTCFLAFGDHLVQHTLRQQPARHAHPQQHIPWKATASALKCFASFELEPNSGKDADQVRMEDW